MNVDEANRRADALFKKEQQLREVQQAMAEYEAELRAMREKTARLQALRLARDAANQSTPLANQKGAAQLGSTVATPRSLRTSILLPGGGHPHMKRREFITLLGGAVFVPQAALVAGGVGKPHVFEKAADAAAKRSRRRLREETMTATEKAAVRYKMIVALLLSCVSTAGYAQPYFNASGIGRSGCGQYLSAFHDRPPGKIRTITHPEGEFVDEAARYTDWLAGFFTASNWWMARTGKGNSVRADYAIIDVWMKRWCEQNPTKSVLEGAIEYVNSGAN